MHRLSVCEAGDTATMVCLWEMAMLDACYASRVVHALLQKKECRDTVVSVYADEQQHQQIRVCAIGLLAPAS